VAPRALMRVDGRVDTHVLLASLVAQASRDAGIAQPEVIPSGDGVEVRVVQKADGETEKHHFYTVNSGDSLGAIAQKFYGDANRFMVIYEANRMIVSSPDKIRVGQRLVIPQA
jgi:nucleoid-associated protein YgaU